MTKEQIESKWECEVTELRRSYYFHEIFDNEAIFFPKDWPESKIEKLMELYDIPKRTTFREFIEWHFNQYDFAPLELKNMIIKEAERRGIK